MSMWLYWHAAAVYRQMRTTVPVALVRFLWFLPLFFLIPGATLNVLAYVADSNLYQCLYSLLFGVLGFAYISLQIYIYTSLSGALRRFVANVNRTRGPAPA